MLGILTSVHTRFVHARKNIDNFSLPKLNVKINTRRCWFFVETERHTRVRFSPPITYVKKMDKRCKKNVSVKIRIVFQFEWQILPFGLTPTDSYKFLKQKCLSYDKTIIYSDVVWLLLRTMMNDEHDEKYKM